MLTLDININQIAKPIVKETKDRKFTTIKIPARRKKNLSAELNKNLDVFILAIEGSYKHLKELDQEKIGNLLKDTDSIIDDLYSFDEKLSKKDYLDNNDVKEKIKYLLKALYKFESILHKSKYKNSPYEKTPQNIINGISKLNRKTLLKITE